ncbi:unnamed protein product [Fraxinus pennsylvanica]|uniref:F-box protein n=1 Tax=Fraxinus pennsylvanica TaxID=56036 RepID=A0AAD1ZNM7_9LAMI|nr:unnamed protein product [Fraxinus pennsylvanica]
MDFKNRQSYKEEDEPTNRLSCLAHEIGLDILSRLPIKSVIQSRFACRSWNLLSHDPRLVHMHMSMALIYQRVCLIFHSNYPLRNQLHFLEVLDVDDNQIVRKIGTPFADSMPEFSVIGSVNGLLCLIDSLSADSIYIYNPFTRDYKVLPKSIEFQEQIVMFGFGFHPITKEYKLIKIVYYPNVNNLKIARKCSRLMTSHRSDVQIYNLGTNEWRSMGEAPYRLEKRSSPGVLVSGRLHWMSQMAKYTRIIVSFDLSNDSFREIPNPDTGHLIWTSSHVAVLGGCLSAATHSGNGALDIWVMKEYGVQESWVKMFTLGAYSPRTTGPELQNGCLSWHNFFAGNSVRILCVMETGEILVEYNGGILVCYNPDSGKFKNLSFQGMPKIFQTTVHVGSLNPVPF